MPPCRPRVEGVAHPPPEPRTGPELRPGACSFGRPSVAVGQRLPAAGRNRSACHVWCELPVGDEGAPAPPGSWSVCLAGVFWLSVEGVAGLVSSFWRISRFVVLEVGHGFRRHRTGCFRSGGRASLGPRAGKRAAGKNVEGSRLDTVSRSSGEAYWRRQCCI